MKKIIIISVMLILGFSMLVNATDDTSVFSCSDDGIYDVWMFNQSSGINLVGNCGTGKVWGVTGTRTYEVQSNTPSGLGIYVNNSEQDSNFFHNTENFLTITETGDMSMVFVVDFVLGNPGAGDEQYLFSNSDSVECGDGSTGMYLWYNDVQNTFNWNYIGGGDDLNGSPTSVLPGWVWDDGDLSMISITRNEGTGLSKIYLNGVELDSGTLTVGGGSTATCGSRLMGKVAVSQKGPSGNLYDFSIFTKELSQAEITAQYNIFLDIEEAPAPVVSSDSSGKSILIKEEVVEKEEKVVEKKEAVEEVGFFGRIFSSISNWWKSITT